MPPRFQKSQTLSPVDDGETVAALVKMLSGMGIQRSRIEAMISKTARPVPDAKSACKPEVANDPGSDDSILRFA